MTYYPIAMSWRERMVLVLKSFAISTALVLAYAMLVLGLSKLMAP